MALLDVIAGPVFYLPFILMIALPMVLVVTVVMMIVRWRKSKNDEEKNDE